MVTDAQQSTFMFRHISFHSGWIRIFRWTLTCLQSPPQLPLGIRCPNWMRPCTCYFLPQLGLPVNSGPRALFGSPGLVDCWLSWLLARAAPWSPVSCTMGHCCVCSLSVALAVFVFWTRGVYPKRSATAATYMTVVRCSQPTRDGDRDDAGLKKSSDGRRVDLAGNPGPGLHFAADPVHIASGVVVRWWWWRSWRWPCCCRCRLCCQSACHHAAVTESVPVWSAMMFSLSSVATVTIVAVVTRMVMSDGRLYIYIYIYIYIFPALERSHCAFFVTNMWFYSVKSVTVAVFIARFDQLSATVVVSIIPAQKPLTRF